MSKSWNWDVLTYDQSAWSVFVDGFKQNSKDFDSFDVWDDRPQIGRHKISDTKVEITLLGYLNGKLASRPAGGRDYDYDYVSGTWVKKTWRSFELPPIASSEYNSDSNWAFDIRLNKWYNSRLNKFYEAPKNLGNRNDYLYLGSTSWIPEKVISSGKQIAYTPRGWIDITNPSVVLPYNFKNDTFTNVPGPNNPGSDSHDVNGGDTTRNYVLLFGAVIGGITLMRLL